MVVGTCNVHSRLHCRKNMSQQSRISFGLFMRIRHLQNLSMPWPGCWQRVQIRLFVTERRRRNTSRGPCSLRRIGGTFGTHVLLFSQKTANLRMPLVGKNAACSGMICLKNNSAEQASASAFTVPQNHTEKSQNKRRFLLRFSDP